ncbi:MAG TPA: BON domain-containing protein [Verrucomicrobiae bacterium]|nr:BON domain-containing protein [Verrucomicrobiae bacterium]
MKKTIAYMMMAAALTVSPVILTTGCAVAHGQESAKEYARDKEITTRIKTALYADPTVHGTQVKVQSLNGVVELSGFVDNQAARQRAGEIAASTPGVAQVYNNLLVPTGR